MAVKLNLATKCKIARYKAILSQREFAELIGCSQGTISAVERGVLPNNKAVILKIEKIYREGIVNDGQECTNIENNCIH